MRSGLPLLGWALCLLPAACAASSTPGGDGTGTFAPTAPAGTDTSSSGGAPADGTGIVTGVSASSSSGAMPPSGSSGSSSGSSGSSGGSTGGGTPMGSSSGTPLGSGSDAGVTTQSKMTPDLFADAGPYSPPADAGNGTHHPGESCMQSGCHGSGGGTEAPAFVIGGTVFKDYAGTIPYPGVEIRVQDANGRTLTTYSRNNGNFYFGGAALALPALVAARDATTTRSMVTQLTTASMGSCASAGCHVVGGSPATGTYYPIHVP